MILLRRANYATWTSFRIGIPQVSLNIEPQRCRYSFPPWPDSLIFELLNFSCAQLLSFVHQNCVMDTLYPLASYGLRSPATFQAAPERRPDQYGSSTHRNQKKCAHLAEAFFKDSVKRARERNQSYALVRETAVTDMVN